MLPCKIHPDYFIGFHYYFADGPSRLRKSFGMRMPGTRLCDTQIVVISA